MYEDLKTMLNRSSRRAIRDQRDSDSYIKYCLIYGDDHVEFLVR